ncbi:hypothetical protein C8R46DRAFT_289896 [Mycena filopes]|nr:hypothetical protein C8R46DRAFT_289896 [Mycena filopes]
MASDDVVESLREYMAYNSARIAELENQLDSATTRVQQLEEEKEELAPQLAALQDKLKVKKETFEAKLERAEAPPGVLENLSNQIEHHRARIAELENQLDTAAHRNVTRVQRLEEGKDELATQVAALRNRLKVKQETFEAKLERVEGPPGVVEKLNKHLEHNRARIAELENQLDTAAHRNVTRVQQLEGEKEELEAKLAALRDRLKVTQETFQVVGFLHKYRQTTKRLA